MSRERVLLVYSDYKSPYAYLAKDLVYDLQDELGFSVTWRPYTLDIADYLGDARVDEMGAVIEENRTDHQWRRVRYSYMDVRRYANQRGLIVRGPKKIFDSSLAAIGMLYAQNQGVFRRYHDAVFERFWRRELDIENPEAIAGVLAECSADSRDFSAFLSGSGRAAHDHYRAEAEAIGVFGVPTFVVDGELFWGREHLPLIRERLQG